MHTQEQLNWRASLIVLIFLFLSGQICFADELVERRTIAGIKFFRSLLAADLDISEKKNENGKLLLVLVYHDDKNRTVAVNDGILKSQSSTGSPTIRDLPVEVEVTDDFRLRKFQDRRLAGIFLTEQLPDTQLSTLVRYGIKNKVIVYSPFEGDVEKGILGGLSVEARVLPLINLTTLRESGIRIKSFFLKVAKSYE